MIFRDVYSSWNVIWKYLIFVRDKVIGFVNFEVNENKDVILFLFKIIGFLKFIYGIFGGLWILGKK